MTCPEVATPLQLFEGFPPLDLAPQYSIPSVILPHRAFMLAAQSFSASVSMYSCSLKHASWHHSIKYISLCWKTSELQADQRSSFPERMIFQQHS